MMRVKRAKHLRRLAPIFKITCSVYLNNGKLWSIKKKCYTLEYGGSEIFSSVDAGWDRPKISSSLR